MTVDPDQSTDSLEPEQGLDLDALGQRIEATDAQAADRARRHLESVGRGHRLGRLADLAQWWAGVRGDARAMPPGRVRHIGVEVALPSDETSVDEALEWGLRTADEAADSGVDLLLLTVDDAIGARLVSAELMGLDPVEANGWPEDRDLDDDEWMDELVVLRDGLRRTRGLRGDLVALLRAVGSPRMTAASALVVQATARRTPILLDGPGAAAAALLARRTAYVANQWWQAAHVGDAPLHARTVTSLNLDPLSSLQIGVEDGTAARLGLAILTLAAQLLTLDPEQIDEPVENPVGDPVGDPGGEPEHLDAAEEPEGPGTSGG